MSTEEHKIRDQSERPAIKCLYLFRSSYTRLFIKVERALPTTCQNQRIFIAFEITNLPEQNEI